MNIKPRPPVAQQQRAQPPHAHAPFRPFSHVTRQYHPQGLRNGIQCSCREQNADVSSSLFESPLPSEARAPDGEAGSEGAESEVVVGIDLGTTNSAVSIIQGQDPVVVPDPDTGNTVPSVVAFTGDGVLVGAKAKRQAAVNPRNTYYSTKRIIGKKFEDVDSKQFPYSVVADQDGNVCMQCDHIGSGVVQPQQVAAYLIAHLIDNVEIATGQTVNKAVISVPAYFDAKQREATLEAGKLAGLEKVKLVREPEAAALAYGIDKQRDQTVLVFDLGGGTFDVSILEVGGGAIEVLSTGGDSSLGGDDWDQAIVDWLQTVHLKDDNLLEQNPGIRSNLRWLAESAKVKLSTQDSVNLNLPLQGGIEAELTRQLFNRLTQKLFSKCELPIRQACLQAGINLEEVWKERAVQGKDVQVMTGRNTIIDQVLLVGGSTKMPAASDFVHSITNIRPRPFLVNPDDAVSLGAALQAGMIQGQLGEVMVLDVWRAALARAVTQKKLKNRWLLKKLFTDEEIEELMIRTGGNQEEIMTEMRVVFEESFAQTQNTKEGKAIKAALSEYEDQYQI